MPFESLTKIFLVTPLLPYFVGPSIKIHFSVRPPPSEIPPAPPTSWRMNGPLYFHVAFSLSFCFLEVPVVTICTSSYLACLTVRRWSEGHHSFSSDLGTLVFGIISADFNKTLCPSQIINCHKLSRAHGCYRWASKRNGFQQSTNSLISRATSLCLFPYAVDMVLKFVWSGCL